MTRGAAALRAAPALARSFADDSTVLFVCQMPLVRVSITRRRPAAAPGSTRFSLITTPPGQTYARSP
jgi:hypothetical protein